MPEYRIQRNADTPVLVRLRNLRKRELQFLFLLETSTAEAEIIRRRNTLLLEEMDRQQKDSAEDWETATVAEGCPHCQKGTIDTALCLQCRWDTVAQAVKIAEKRGIRSSYPCLELTFGGQHMWDTLVLYGSGNADLMLYRLRCVSPETQRACLKKTRAYLRAHVEFADAVKAFGGISRADVENRTLHFVEPLPHVTKPKRRRTA